MNELLQLMQAVCTALLWPVLGLLLLLVVFVCLDLGGLIRECLARFWTAKIKAELVQTAANGELTAEIRATAIKTALSQAWPGFKAVLPNQKMAVEKYIADFEIAGQGVVSRSRSLARLGPMLGLMGTLIPLGPALVGLSTGDVETLLSNLVIAFNTTILGLGIGVVSYFSAVVRRQWYARDLSDLEYCFEICSSPTAQA